MNETITQMYYMTYGGAILSLGCVIFTIVLAIILFHSIFYRKIFGEVLKDFSIAMIAGIITGASINQELWNYLWLIGIFIITLVLGAWLKESTKNEKCL